jgi:asparagine synthase (glutamine-hydrolysing)
MCSILAILDLKTDALALRRTAIRLSRLQRHRGPDWSGIFSNDHAILAHERLAIVDVLHGAQPLRNAAGTHVLAVNGEIYNHRELRASLAAPYSFLTDSDCEVILALYRDHDVGFLDMLNGIFAFVLYDAERNRYLIARDPVGVVPLYMGEDAAGNVYVASEMKALVPVCTSISEFPPGHYLDSRTGAPQRYWERAWRDYDTVADNPADPQALRTALSHAVERQLMSDVPYGVLLSGGLDSSIIAATARTFAARRVEEQGRTAAWWPQLHSFSIGLEGSPDLSAARAAAQHIGSVHHEFVFTVQEGIDALSDVIYHLETYDVTTIRAATPMYLMARRIRAMGVKMVLSGEGADEIFGGYLYFHRAPDARAFHEETIRKLDRLHLYDCLRANKAMAAWGVEARVPFLDREFLDVAMSIAPTAKMAGPARMEKHILREAFAQDLPAAITWRQKEQFSDGVGYGWIDSLREHAAAEVSDQAMASAHVRFPCNPPATKEACFYRTIFQEHFPLEACARCVPGGASVACSTAEALAWDPALAAVVDPSGRAVRGVHQAAI